MRDQSEAMKEFSLSKYENMNLKETAFKLVTQRTDIFLIVKPIINTKANKSFKAKILSAAGP